MLKKRFIIILSILMLFTLAKGASAADKAINGFYDSLWVSPAGDMALFMFSRYNFFPTILKGKPPVLSGETLPGHHPNDANPWEDSDLYFTYKLPDGAWSKPINMPTNDGRGDCCAMIANQELFFQKGGDIYHAYFRDQKWGKAMKLPMNTKHIETNPHYDAQNHILYWASNANGNFDIWQSKRDPKTQEWHEPERVKGDVNSKAKEDQPFVQNGQMRFSRDGAAGNMLAEMKEGLWGSVRAEPLGTDLYHTEISMSFDGKTAWFVAGDGHAQKMRFMKLHKQENGNWGQAIEMTLTK